MLNGVGDERIHRRHCFFCREKAPAAVGVCAPPPGKPYSSVKVRKLFAGERPLAAVRVCAPHPGKPYFTVGRRKLFAGKSCRRRCEFAPHSRESLILPLRGANFLPGKAPGGGESLRLIPGKALRGANLLPGRAAGGCGGLRLGAGSLRLTPGKALFFR